MPETFDGAVVQVDVGDLEVRCSLHARDIPFDRKPMILRRDEHTARIDLTHGVISAAMPEWKLCGRSAKCETQYLVAEADPEYWSSTGGQLADSVRSIGDRVGVVKQAHAVGLASMIYMDAKAKNPNAPDKKMMEESVPWVPYLWVNNLTVTGKTVSKFEFDQFSGYLSFTQMAVNNKETIS